MIVHARGRPGTGATPRSRRPRWRGGRDHRVQRGPGHRGGRRRGGRCGGARAGCRRSLQAWRPPAVLGVRAYAVTNLACARNYSGQPGARRGGVSRPRSTRRPFQAGVSVASSIPGNRRISVPMAIRPSSRASDAPRQWWMPLPNDRCWAAPAAVRSSAVGVGAPAAGSRLAEPRHGEHEHARLDGLVADVEVGRRDPPRELHRRVVAQQLVDRVGVERRVVAPPFELRAVAEQRERAVADEVHGGLVAGDVEQDHLVERAPRRRAGRRRPPPRSAR